MRISPLLEELLVFREAESVKLPSLLPPDGDTVSQDTSLCANQPGVIPVGAENDTDTVMFEAAESRTHVVGVTVIVVGCDF